MSLNAALETLFLPFETGALDVSNFQNFLFLNAQDHAFLKSINPYCVQTFKPYAQSLLDVGYACEQQITSGSFD